MINKTKKGAALILTIAITSMLIILALSLLFVATSINMRTIAVENSSELKMIAQTGVEKGMSILKEKIANTVMNEAGNSVLYKLASDPKGLNTGFPNDPYMNVLSLATSKHLPITNEPYTIDFNVYTGGTAVEDAATKPVKGDCYIAFNDINDYVDPNDNIQKNCIQITVYAFGVKDDRRTVTAFIDKNSISNYYYDRVFKNTITALGDNSNTSNGSIASSPESTMNDIKIGGNVYVQGNSFNVSSNDIQINGKLKINRIALSNNIAFQDVPHLKFYKYNNYTDTTGSAISTNAYTKPVGGFEWVTNPVSSFAISGDFISAIQKPVIEAVDMKPLNSIAFSGSGFNSEDQILENNLFSLVKEQGTALPAIIAAKCRPTSGTLDLNKLILGRDLDSHLGMRRFIASNSSLNAAYQTEADYLRFFKVIIVDGNVKIDAANLYYDEISDNMPEDVIPEDFRQLKFVNYIIISSGTVTIKGNFEMYNSSIFAKHVVFDTSLASDLPMKVDAVTGNVSLDATVDSASATALMDAYQNLRVDRIAAGETVPSPDDVLSDTIHPGIDYSEQTLKDDTSTINVLREDAKKVIQEKTVKMYGIGAQDSLREMVASLSEYDDALPNDARGYLTNVQKALINEYFIRNFPIDYASGMLFKIINYVQN